jgi:Phosphate-selective porin O and P
MISDPQQHHLRKCLSATFALTIFVASNSALCQVTPQRDTVVPASDASSPASTASAASSEPAPSAAAEPNAGPSAEPGPAPQLPAAPAPGVASAPVPSPSEPEATPAGADTPAGTATGTVPDEQPSAVSEAAQATIKQSKKDKKRQKKQLKRAARKAAAEPRSFKLQARVMAGWQYQVSHPLVGPADSSRQFFLDQARLAFSTRYKKALQLKASVELSDGLKGPPKEDSIRFLRDAWLKYRFSPLLEARIGRFKRPFSRLELRSAGDLPMRGRGVGNGLISSDMGYGARALGLEVRAHLNNPNLTLLLSGSNPTDTGGFDTHARLVYDPVKWLSLGANYAHKVQPDTSTRDTGDFIGGNAWGADLRLKLGGFSLLADATLGEDLRYGSNPPAGFRTRPNAGALAGYVKYSLSVGQKYALEPTVFAEWADADLEYGQSEIVRTVIGCNLTWRKTTLRVMPQVELLRPLGTNAEQLWTKREAYFVMVSSEI